VLLLSKNPEHVFDDFSGKVPARRKTGRGSEERSLTRTSRSHGHHPAQAVALRNPYEVAQ
jgi:hypothetical protein